MIKNILADNEGLKKMIILYFQNSNNSKVQIGREVGRSNASKTAKKRQEDDVMDLRFSWSMIRVGK